MTSKTREAAFAYAANGWPVLRCWTNTVDGCACGRKGCASPGKHPYKSTHGVHDATTNEDAIAKWKGDYNVAIALGHAQLLVIDLDDPKIAKVLRSRDGRMLRETGVVRTNRGLHIYFMCVGEPPTTRDIFNKKTGDNIGQIRGLGGYVVAPPSMGISGKRRYKWIGEKFDEWVPHLATADDPLLYTQRLLRPAGVEVEAAEHVLASALPDVELEEETTLPKAIRKDIRLREIRQILEGKLKPTVGDIGDRSRGVHRAGALLAYAAAEHAYPLAEKRLAGILRALDRRYYGKFTGRPDDQADREYLRSARKVLSLPSARVEPTKTEADQGDDLEEDEAETSSIAAAEYIWDEETQQLCFAREKARGGRTFHPIANFLPQISATAVIDDPDEAEKETAWRLRVRRSEREDGEAIGLRADDYDRSRGLSAALIRKLPYGYTILQGGEEHMLAATKSLSVADAPTYYVPAVPGWYQRGGRWAYVLPGSEVAIGAAGVELAFHLHKEDLRESDAMRYEPIGRYGLGVRPATSRTEKREAWSAFERLFDAASRPHIAAAIILQVLGGPLFDAGVADVPPLVHVVGRTGTFKTSYCLAVLGLMGKFSDISAPVTWRSTPMGLSQALNRARHMTLLIDDYKRAHGGRRDMVGLIQQYADGSHMVRHSLSGQPFERPRGLILSNGEDRFRGEASVAARTTSVEVRDGDISSPVLAECQQNAESGVLARLGALYLQWLARSGVLADGAVREARERAHARLLASEGVTPGHRRTLRSAASLLAVGSIVLRFVKEEGDREAYETVRAAVRSLRSYFVETSGERAQEVEGMAPLDHLTAFLSDKIAAGEVKFRARAEGMDYPRSGPMARIIGWHRKGAVYLSEHLTFAYYQEEMKRRGEELPHDWSSLTQDIRERYGPKSSLQIWVAEIVDAASGQEKEKTSRRVYRVPKAVFDHSRVKKGGKGR